MNSKMVKKINPKQNVRILHGVFGLIANYFIATLFQTYLSNNL